MTGALDPFSAAGGVAVAPPPSVVSTPAATLPVGTLPTLTVRPAPAATPTPAAPPPAALDPFAAAGGVPVPEPAPPATAPPLLQPGQKTGYAANMAAGAVEGSAGLINAASDPFGNLIGKPVATAAIAVHDALAPVFGYEPFPDHVRRFLLDEQTPQMGTQLATVAQHVTGAPALSDVVPGTRGEAQARAAAAGVAAAGPLGAPVIGAAGALVGHAAAEAAPERYKDVAALIGNFLGGGLTAAGTAALTAGGRFLQQKVAGFPAGARADLIDPATGRPFPGQPEGGTTQGQQTAAGQSIIKASGQKAPALLGSIDAATAKQPLAASQRSMGQTTGNIGVLTLERKLRNENPQPFTEAEAASSVAHVDALRGLSGPAAAGDAAGKFVADRLAQIRVAEDAIEQSARTVAERRAQGLGGDPAQLGEQELGAAHQKALDTLREPVKAAAARLYQAIDPDGTLALRVGSVRDVARQLLAEVNTRMGGTLGPEGEALTAAAGMRDVELFSDLRALDTNLSAAQRAIRTSPQLGAESAPFRRVTALRKAIDAAMSDEAAGRVEAETAQGASGPATMGGQLATEAAQWKQGNGRADAAAGSPETSGRAATGRVGAVPGVGGEAGESAQGRGNAAGDSGLAAPPATLVPNFSPTDRAQLRAANDAYRAYKDQYRSGAVGKVLDSAAGPTGFRMAESAVPKALFHGGPAGAEAVDSLIRATGSPEAAAKLLGDYPAFSFRRAAERDGVIDPARADRWLEVNKAALDKLPGLRDRFADAATATRTLEEAAARGQAAIEAYQNSAARHYLAKATGEAVEPQKAIERLLASPTAIADARELMRLTAGDAAATDGIKANLADHILRKFSSTTEAGTTGEMELKAATVQQFLANPSTVGVARAVLGPEAVGLLEQIGADIELGKRAVSATRIPGSPGTASDLLQAVGHKGHGMSFFGQILTGEVVGQMIGGGLEMSMAGGVLTGSMFAGAMVAMNAMRIAGIQTAADLARAGLLDPAGLGRLLVVKGDIAAKPAIFQRLLERIAALGVSGSVQREEKR